MSQLYWPKAQMECNKLEEGEKKFRHRDSSCSAYYA